MHFYFRRIFVFFKSLSESAMFVHQKVSNFHTIFYFQEIRSIGELACILVERESAHVAKGSADSLRAIEIVHACLSYGAPDRSICEMAFDPLSRLQCVETAERHPRLREELFQSALDVLVTKQVNSIILCF